MYGFRYTGYQNQSNKNVWNSVLFYLKPFNTSNLHLTLYIFIRSSFDALKKSLVGVQKYIQATDLSEASQEAVEEKLRATDRQ